MNYYDFKRKQLLLDMQNKISTIANFVKISIDDMKLVDSKIGNVYSIDEQASPISKLRTELEELDKSINDKVLVNLSNEIKMLK